MDRERTRSLIQFMRNEGLKPTKEAEAKRKEVIEKLKEIVLLWIRKVAWQRGLAKGVISNTCATVFSHGSYGLGVYGSDSDLDAVCVAPQFATLGEDFFIVLRNMLQSRPEVSDIQCIRSASVPIMCFKFYEISVDLAFARLCALYVPHDVNLSSPNFVVADRTSQKSMSGVLVNKHILQRVPHMKNFQRLLRCIKLWARRRGIYSHVFGLFGGVHLAVLATYVCQLYPDASLSVLVSNFFESFSSWSWPTPVILQDTSIPDMPPDGGLLMPIMMPPYGWCKSYITKSTFRKIKEELRRGYSMTWDTTKGDFEWRSLFEPFPYAKMYPSFLRIFLSAPDEYEFRDWVGRVKSRIQSLLLKLEMVQGYCDPNPQEYMDHTVSDPNVVFYWGLLSPYGSSIIDIISIWEDFMISVNMNHYIDRENNPCKLELSIVDNSKFPRIVQLEPRARGCRSSDSKKEKRIPVYSRHAPNYIVGYVATHYEYMQEYEYDSDSEEYEGDGDN